MSVVLNEWPSNPKGYKILNAIGCGYFGTVWKGEILEGEHKGEYVAIKKIELDKCADNKISDIRRSMLLANLLDHPNILSYKITFICKQELWLVSEIMEGGSIDKIIQVKYPNGIKDQTLIATILKEILKGLRYLHQNNQIHRDIKGAGILIGKDGSIKISDFGVATIVKDGQKRNTFIGSPCWMAPEVLEQDDKSGYDFKADIWSLGITALEMAYGRPPNYDLNTMKLILKTLKDDPPRLGEESCWDESFRDFISYCLVKDPSKRKSADELLNKCKTFFSKCKGPEYIKEKLLKGFIPASSESADNGHHSNRYPDRKCCTMIFDFGIGKEEKEFSENIDDLQVHNHNHLTKKESEFILQQSLNKSIPPKMKSFHVAPVKIKEEIKPKKFPSATTNMIYVGKAEQLSGCKGDIGNDFHFLGEEEN